MTLGVVVVCGLGGGGGGGEVCGGGGGVGGGGVEWGCVLGFGISSCSLFPF